MCGPLAVRLLLALLRDFPGEAGPARLGSAFTWACLIWRGALCGARQPAWFGTACMCLHAERPPGLSFGDLPLAEQC